MTSSPNGRVISLLNVVDDFNREGLGIEVDYSLPSKRVTRVLDQIIEWRGKPACIRLDNELPTLSSHFQEKESHQHPSKGCHKIFALVPMTSSNYRSSTTLSGRIASNNYVTQRFSIMSLIKGLVN